MTEIVSTWTGNRYPVKMNKPMRGKGRGMGWFYVVSGTVETENTTHYFSAFASDPFDAVAQGLAAARAKILQAERYRAYQRGIHKVTFRDFTVTGLRKVMWPYVAYVGFRPPQHRMAQWDAERKAAL